jgi:formylglycine-generating enzyme required for sulfatase activity/serine/threonine protein kinase
VIDLVHASRDGWTLARALEAVLKVCDAVEYAHSLGVVHRDLKPDNVMIGRFGETYVMDWGLARVVDRDHETRDARSTRSHDDAQEQASLHATREHATADGAVLGTPAYMSPEQAEARHADVGPQSDVYSVGAILYHLLCGRAPYAAAETTGQERSQRSILDAVRAGPPPRVESIAARTSPELAAICAKAMARAPSERYADMRAMSDDLRAYMEGRVVRAHDGGALAELEKWIARNRGLATAIAAAIFVAVGGLAAVSYVQTSSKNEILKLSDLRRVETLVREAATLWPAVPEKIDAMERWLAEADALVANRDLHERTLAEMNERSNSSVLESIERSNRSSPDSTERADPSARDSVERSDRSAPRSSAGSDHSLADSIERSASNADRWRFENQSKLVSALERFADPDPRRGLIANVRERLADARDSRRVSIDEHAAEWRAAVASIANESECPAYRGLAIAPQIGLVPLGRDPRSKLWEFAHLVSGAPPRRSGDGVLELTERTGIVLVLIPGGRTTIGSQPPKSGRPSDPLTDSLSQREEEPPREIELAPFFISKYELTEVQWRRWCERDPDVMDTAPRASTIDRAAHLDDRGNAAGDAASSALASSVASATDALAPMGSIAWLEAERVTAHMGLALPTEAQWEHAARAGTRTRWWCGNEPRLLLDAANVGSGIDGSLPYVDGFEGPAPVDALRANPFGLHNVHGNVSEWTADSFWPDHDRPLRAGDGLALAPDSGLRAVRGGSYRGSAASARSAARVGVAAENHDATIGVRAARALEP